MYTELKDLIGKTFTSVIRVDDLGYSKDAGIKFVGEKSYGLSHQQDCCESVYIKDVVGDLSDLEGTPILVAEERSEDIPEEYLKQEKEKGNYFDDCSAWTFYEFRTIKGSVTVQFEGSSNGYYGIDASLYEL